MGSPGNAKATKHDRLLRQYFPDGTELSKFSQRDLIVLH